MYADYLEYSFCDPSTCANAKAVGELASLDERLLIWNPEAKFLALRSCVRPYNAQDPTKLCGPWVSQSFSAPALPPYKDTLAELASIQQQALAICQEWRQTIIPYLQQKDLQDTPENIALMNQVYAGIDNCVSAIFQAPSFLNPGTFTSSTPTSSTPTSSEGLKLTDTPEETQANSGVDVGTVIGGTGLGISLLIFGAGAVAAYPAYKAKQELALRAIASSQTAVETIASLKNMDPAAKLATLKYLERQAMAAKQDAAEDLKEVEERLKTLRQEEVAMAKKIDQSRMKHESVMARKSTMGILNVTRDLRSMSPEAAKADFIIRLTETSWLHSDTMAIAQQANRMAMVEAANRSGDPAWKDLSMRNIGDVLKDEKLTKQLVDTLFKEAYRLRVLDSTIDSQIQSWREGDGIKGENWYTKQAAINTRIMNVDLTEEIRLREQELKNLESDLTTLKTRPDRVQEVERLTQDIAAKKAVVRERLIEWGMAYRRFERATPESLEKLALDPEAVRATYQSYMDKRQALHDKKFAEHKKRTIDKNLEDFAQKLGVDDASLEKMDLGTSSLDLSFSGAQRLQDVVKLLSATNDAELPEDMRNLPKATRDQLRLNLLENPEIVNSVQMLLRGELPEEMEDDIRQQVADRWDIDVNGNPVATSVPVKSFEAEFGELRSNASFASDTSFDRVSTSDFDPTSRLNVDDEVTGLLRVPERASNADSDTASVKSSASRASVQSDASVKSTASRASTQKEAWDRSPSPENLKTLQEAQAQKKLSGEITDTKITNAEVMGKRLMGIGSMALLTSVVTMAATSASLAEVTLESVKKKADELFQSKVRPMYQRYVALEQKLMQCSTP
jgi:hypothetical protein